MILIFAFIFMMVIPVFFWFGMQYLETLQGEGTFVYMTLEGMTIGGFIGMMAGVVPVGVEALIISLWAIMIWRRHR